MKALVTGGAGFIGSHVVELLQAAGHQVAVLDNLSNGKRANLAPDVPLHVGCLTDAEFVDATFAAVQPEVVIHLAAQVSVIESMKDPFDDMRRNIGGSLNVILAARRHGQPKIVYSSTGGAAYGDPDPSLLPVPETCPARPLAPYGITKHTVEHYLDAEAVNHGQRYTVLRFSNVYGPRQDPHGEAGVVAIFTVRILEGGVCKIFGDGEQTRDFVYVGDVARAVVAATTRADGEIINIGTAVETTVNEVAAALEAAWGRPYHLVHEPARTGEVKRIALAVAKARELLDWTPQVAFREGIRRTLDSYRS
ncbi:MAG: NAD-dependent epimerase/dehydratase family protein [Fimbriimonadaceae bacterium]|nr:NAD-dependent epimerase/dehydratase family protein [Fimbriimonadaceae bacterium]